MWPLPGAAADGTESTAGTGQQGSIEIATLEHRLLRSPVQFLARPEAGPLVSVLEAEFRPLTADDINQGITDQTFWLRVRLRNSGTETRRWVLHGDNSYLDHLDIFYRDFLESSPTGSGAADFLEISLSDREPFHERPLNYRKLAWAHETAAGGQTELYLRLHFSRADAMSLNFHLWDEAAFVEKVGTESLAFGAWYGSLLALALISVVLASVLRQRAYFYYAVFQLATLFMWALLNGLGFQYLWPESVYLHNEGFHIGFLLFTFFAFQFTRSFFRLEHILPLVNRVLLGAQLICLGAVLLRFAGFYEAVLHLAFLMMASLIFLPVVGWLAYRKGLSHARWFCAAWLVYSVSLVMSLLSAYSTLFSWGMESLIYTQAGSMVEATLLLFALAERLMQIDLDRRHALDLAHRDELTGLGNRRRLLQYYQELRLKFPGDSRQLFLVLIDLDFFKEINDRYGHEAGDHVLREVADLLRRCSREEDACIRYGGEEFALLLRTSGEEDALSVAERIRSQFADHPTFFEGQQISHTLSVGLVHVEAAPRGQLPGPEVMLARADAALYEAKSGGRNQIILAPGPLGI